MLTAHLWQSPPELPEQKDVSVDREALGCRAEPQIVIPDWLPATLVLVELDGVHRHTIANLR